MNLCGTIILFSLAPLLCLAQNPDGKTSRKRTPFRPGPIRSSRSGKDLR